MKPVKRTILKSPFKLSSREFPPHLQTHVSELHRLGHFGKGIKIAAIDSVVDCSHPALGGGFGKGYKIGFGRDLSGDHYDGANKPRPDENPCGSCAVGDCIHDQLSAPASDVC